MNKFSEHPFESESAGLDPLPLEFEFQSRRTDQAIGRMAKRDRLAIPSGMSSRVFHASAGLLPQRETVTASKEDSRFTFSSFRMMLAHLNVGRVAMAAMVLLAFGIGALMMHTSGVKIGSDSQLARNADRTEHAQPVTPAVNTSSHVAEWEIAAVTSASTPGSVDEMNDKVAYLLEADTLTTPEEVRIDMAQLLASLE
jgi:hypothetical protein